MSSASPSRARSALLAAALLASLAAPAHALRVVDWNVTNFPSVSGSARIPRFRTVLVPLGADVLATEEIQSQVGSDKIRDSVLNVIEPGQWAAAPFILGNDTNNQLYYKPSKVQLLGNWAFYPNPANHLRLVHVYRLKPAGYSSDQAEFRIYICHLKASTGYEAQRNAEAQGIRDSMNAAPPGTHMILLGDFNCYAGTEPALTTLTQSTSNDNGRLYDPLNLLALSDWNQVPSLAAVYTQCPCLNNCPTSYGFSGGGLDDRFDMMLGTLNLGDGIGLAFVPNSYAPIGNDGQHYNTDINILPTNLYGQAYADSLIRSSDHLPIRMDVQLPARIAGPAPLGFPTVIVGATNPSLGLAVSNVAVAPAESLRYSFAADPGFLAPAGSFALAAGDPAAAHAIAMDAAVAGAKSGLLHVSANDPDHPLTNVTLSGTVLRHAVASLDSLVPRDTLTLDFGYAEAGAFQALPVRVHDLGWDALQARLAVGAAGVAGGDGRFSIVGGFAPALLAGVGQTWSVAFDDAGATEDSTYQATLTFSSADEALPGAAPRPDLTVTLLARVKPGAITGVAGPGAPVATRLYVPEPNPLVGASTVRFDLALGGEVKLEAYDALGRRVATLMQGRLDPGRYTARWDGRAAGGAPVQPGLYFVRLTGRGIGAQTVRLAILR